jgi:CRISPR-associated protein Cmr2
LRYAAGGSALIVAATKIAEQIAEEIQKLYLSETRVATISVVYRPTGPREWVKGVEASGNDFGALVKQMGYDLRRAKESRAFHPFIYAPPHSRRCDSCEMRPAETAEPDPEGREAFLCIVCTRKRQYGRDQKSLYLQQFEEFLSTTEGKVTAYSGHWRKVREHSEVEPARDLDEIGKAAHGKAKGYVGVIYIDGNDIGHRIEEARTPAEYRTLSEELRRATTLATYRALAQQSLLQKVNRTNLETQWVHAFEIVAIGGDDVFLIVPGDVALEIARTLCGRFEYEFNGRMTMSAGVLIMPAHLPLYYAREIVEVLLKSAKRAGRRDRGTLNISPAYIDFQIITGDTSLSTDLEDFRRQVYVGRSSLEDWQRLTERPHTLTRLRHLLDVIRWAKQESFPPSQLYQLRQAIVEHIPLWSQNWYRYQLARDEQNQCNGWRAFHKQLFGTCLPAVAEAPWRPLEAEQEIPVSEHATPIIDLVEVFDFVRYEGGGGSASQD